MTTSFNLDGGIHEIPVANAPGRMWLCGKHYIAPRYEQVRRDTDDALIVCLVQPHELAGRYDDYLAWIRSANGVDALWFPVHDLNVPEFDEALELFERTSTELRDGRNLVVHCAAGIGRAGTTAVCTLMMLGSSADTALATVRHHRPMAGPEAGGQFELVTKLHERLSR